MPFHIKNAETDALARKLAGQRKIGLTEAVHQALAEALAREAEKISLPELAVSFCRELKARGAASKAGAASAGREAAGTLAAGVSAPGDGA